MRRLLYLPAIAITGWFLLSGMWAIVDVVAVHGDDRSLEFRQADTVVIDSEAGGVHVIGDDGDTIRVDLHVREGAQKATARAHRTDAGAVVVTTRCPAFMNVVCRVDATVRVPRGTTVRGDSIGGIRVEGTRGPVDLDIQNGSLVVIEAKGTIRARNGNGRIQVDDSTGPLDLHTVNGRIESTGVTTDAVTARTGNGRIHLAPANAPGRITARTSNGRIAVDLPAAAPAYAVSTHTSNGSVTTSIRTDPGADHAIEARTGNGRISIAYR